MLSDYCCCCDISLPDALFHRLRDLRVLCIWPLYAKNICETVSDVIWACLFRLVKARATDAVTLEDIDRLARCEVFPVQDGPPCKFTDAWKPTSNSLYLLVFFTHWYNPISAICLSQACVTAPCTGCYCALCFVVHDRDQKPILLQFGAQNTMYDKCHYSQVLTFRAEQYIRPQVLSFRAWSELLKSRIGQTLAHGSLHSG
jgi:hypothetical protein